MTLVRQQLHPGTFLLQGYLDEATQAALFGRCLTLGAAPAGFYRPVHKSGATMSVSMMCLGVHWNARTYVYEATRSDHDGLPAQPLPGDLAALAQAAAHEVGMSIAPDICLVNLYEGEARLGLHRDQDERPETLAAGVPIVSVSLGDQAEYVLGGLRRTDPVQPLVLSSGDVVVMGGPSRLRYHGVQRTRAGTAPAGTGPGRINLTFRQR